MKQGCLVTCCPPRDASSVPPILYSCPFRSPPPDKFKRQIASAFCGGRLSRSYILGAMHDGTVRRRTIRISQREESYVAFLRNLVRSMAGGAWTYKEGRSRRLYVVEFSRSFMRNHRIRTRKDRVDYVRGYFDAEGGVPRTMSHGPYLYFAQKDLKDLKYLLGILLKLGISCGQMHRPSWRADPEYWRFYVKRKSIRLFVALVGSWHPRKGGLLLKM